LFLYRALCSIPDVPRGVEDIIYEYYANRCSYCGLFILVICVVVIAFAHSFITRWLVPNCKRLVALPLVPSGSYSFLVDWGDGEHSYIYAFDQPERTHNYRVAGIYEIQIFGKMQGICFDEHESALQLQQVTQWGDLELGNTGGYFSGCHNLIVTASDKLQIKNTTNLCKMFYNARLLDMDIEHWDTSNVTVMAHMFSGAESFRGKLSHWETSNVCDMRCMFYAAYSFSGDIGTWDTSSVLDMTDMFGSCFNFNSDIGKWNTSNVKYMTGMFWECTLFNHDLAWDTSSVIDMSNMFRDCVSFNGNISAWNTGNVHCMSGMFYNATLFNSDIGSWNTGRVRNMYCMFFQASSFNCDISNWDVCKVHTTHYMFFGASHFDEVHIRSWVYHEVVS